MSVDVREKILFNARKLFMRFSISRVTVKEIADESGVSKKTIYNYFDSKDDLKKKVVDNFLNEVNKKITKICNDSEMGFYDKIKAWINFVKDFLFYINKDFLKDIQKKHREIWRMIEDYRKNNILRLLTTIIDEGKKENILRKNIDKEMVTEIFYRNIQIITDADYIYNSKYIIKEHINNFLDIFFNGLLKEKKEIKLN